MIKKRIWLTAEQKNEVILRYTAGEAPTTIAESFGVCANNVRNVLRVNGIEIRDRVEARTKLGHWREAFDVLTPESEYWIGILYSDGAVYEPEVGSSVISVGLAERDRGHLEKLRAFLRSDHAITEHKSTIRNKTHPGVRFTIRSNSLAKTLYGYGMKDKNLERIASTELAASRDFWRGMVDGDGHIGVSNGKVRLDLCGGKRLMHQFHVFLRQHGIGNNASVLTQGKISRLAVSCAEAIKAIRLLYEGASVALDRKQRDAEAIMRGEKASVRGLRQMGRQ